MSIENIRWLPPHGSSIALPYIITPTCAPGSPSVLLAPLHALPSPAARAWSLDMALSIHVAADVTADVFKRQGSSRSSSSATRNGVSRRGFVSSSPQTKRSQFVPNLSTWIRSTSPHATPPLSEDPGPSGSWSPSAISPTARRQKQQGSSLLNKAVRRSPESFVRSVD